MNRSSARLTQTFLAITFLSLGATACTGATSTAPPTAGLPARSPAGAPSER